MSDIQHHQRARDSEERQYEIDQLTSRYEEEYRAGKSPKIADYIQRHPEFAQELMEFALFFHTFEADDSEPPPTPAAAFSPAVQAARTRIREPTPANAGTTLPGIIRQARLAGHMAPKLAEMLGLSLDIVTKLDAHAIVGASIPRTLIERLASALSVAPDAVAAYLGSPQRAQAGGSFFYADEAPKQRQETFLDAIQSSRLLSPEQKQAWADTVAQEEPGG